MNITVIGVGYVGIVTGIVHAYFGNRVVCVDNDRDKINKLNQGILPIYEPGLKEMLSKVRSNITFTSDYNEGMKNVEVIFIAVDTPSEADGSPNVSHVHAVANSIAHSLIADGVIIVNKSTVPIGCGCWVESLIHEAFKEKYGAVYKKVFYIVSNPEFLREGSAVFDMLYPDRIILGTDSEYAKEKMIRLYEPFVEQTFDTPSHIQGLKQKNKPVVVETDIVSAELIKYTANAFLALKISFINEIACLSEKLGADILDVAEGIGLDQRIGKDFLNAGVGWGGSCFGKDTNALIHIAKNYGIDFNITKACRKVNYDMRKNIVKKIQSELKIIDGRTIALMGLSFKPNTDDLRDSPAIDIARELLELNAKVKVYDPVAMERAKTELTGLNIEYADTVEALFEQADGAVLVTEWPIFNEIDWNMMKEKMRHSLIFDGRNYFDHNKLESLGFRVIGVGR